MLQQAALTAELGDELQAVSRTDTQDPDNVYVVQASHRHHVLQRTFRFGHWGLKGKSNKGLSFKVQISTSCWPDSWLWRVWGLFLHGFNCCQLGFTEVKMDSDDNQGEENKKTSWCRSTVDALASVTSGKKTISSLMEEQNIAAKAFHNGKYVFHPSLNWLQQEFDQWINWWSSAVALYGSFIVLVRVSKPLIDGNGPVIHPVTYCVRFASTRLPRCDRKFRNWDMLWGKWVLETHLTCRSTGVILEVS